MDGYFSERLLFSLCGICAGSTLRIFCFHTFSTGFAHQIFVFSQVFPQKWLKNGFFMKNSTFKRFFAIS